jgi:hypothetical protein
MGAARTTAVGLAVGAIIARFEIEHDGLVESLRRIRHLFILLKGQLPTRLNFRIGSRPLLEQLVFCRL